MWSAFNEFHYRCDTHRFQKLFARADLVKMIADLPGDIIDAGAFKGTSTLQFAHALETYQPNSRSRVLSFDTFEATFPRTRADERDVERRTKRRGSDDSIFRIRDEFGCKDVKVEKSKIGSFVLCIGDIAAWSFYTSSFDGSVEETLRGFAAYLDGSRCVSTSRDCSCGANFYFIVKQYIDQQWCCENEEAKTK